MLQDQGNVISDQAQIDTAKLNIAYCHIVAPVNGRVGLRQVDQGNYVTAGDANGLVVVTQLSPDQRAVHDRRGQSAGHPQARASRRHASGHRL